MHGSEGGESGSTGLPYPYPTVDIGAFFRYQFEHQCRGAGRELGIVDVAIDFMRGDVAF